MEITDAGRLTGVFPEWGSEQMSLLFVSLFPASSQIESMNKNILFYASAVQDNETKCVGCKVTKPPKHFYK